MKARKAQGARKAPAPVTPKAASSKIGIIATCLLLAAATLFVYAQTFSQGFVYYDDDRYVYENSMVKAGLSAKGLVWAFTTFYYANWHPLTWISYMLDYQLFGLNAGAMHVVNVILHLGATVLLFLAFLRMTRQPWRCALVAGIFALHPLHVESVAWISERKDVLSTLFQMLTLLLYVRYTEDRRLSKYAAMVAAFALSLLAKPMAVTVPFVLLLLDIWPLGRLNLASWRLNLKGLLWEKTPLLAMSAVASVLTFLAQRSGGAVASLTAVPFAERLANAVVAYVRYIGNAFWPVDLAVLYPSQTQSPVSVIAAALILTAITAAAVRTFRQRPYFLVGWLWYVGMLAPVIGLVQVGAQSMADRYTYVPLVGLSIALIWMVADAVRTQPFLRRAAAAAAILILAALAAHTYRQAGYWQSSRSLFEHTLAVTKENHIIQNNYGVVLQREGKHEEATAMYRLALVGNPDYVDAHTNLGHELMLSGQFADAMTQLTDALRLKPDSSESHADMGLLLATRGSFAEAAVHLERSVALEPANPEAQSNLCYVLHHLGRQDQAIAACNAALKLQPDMLNARFNLGTALAAKGQVDAAAVEFSRVLEANPNYTAARAALDDLQRARSR